VSAVLLVSLGATPGLQASDEELAASIERAGASVELAAAAPPRAVRTLALTDLGWALAARRAASAALARSRHDAVIYSTITAALLAPRPGAIRFDALAASNRPGRHGVWQRPRERALLARAPLLVPVSESALAGAPLGHAPAILVPIAVEPSGPLGDRDIAAITYAADAHKKGLDRVLAAWALARRDGEELFVAGSAPVADAEGVRALGPLPREHYRALLRRARVYVSAPRREEYGIAQLEALVDGAMLVALSGGPSYAALPLALAADPRLVGSDLAHQIRTALDDPAPVYAPALEEFSRRSVDRLVAERLLPALLAHA
jgi:glycosyltransferase involved in cell wall biosynthesis